MYDEEKIIIGDIKTIQELEDVTKGIAGDVALLISHLLDNPHAFSNYNDEYNPWHALLALEFPDYIETFVDYTIKHHDVFNRFFPSIQYLTIYADCYPPEQVEKFVSFILNNSVIFERLMGGDIRRLINFTAAFPDHRDTAFEKADLLNNPEKFKKAIHSGQTLPALSNFPKP